MTNDLKKIQIDAAAFRRLVKHLQENKSLQNIDLMNLAGFCRNCLSKWMVEEAKKLKVDLEYEEARTDVYGMDYPEWKKKYQTPLK
tara:strand:+ start:693 stop:950 length:258 start_codon:yes stop_codon:yes gene_type:complete